MTRWKAASIHLCISAAIGMTAAAFFLFVWYPPPYFRAAGADELVLLLMGIDLALGPLLTLIVFRSGKRGLKFDLVVIAALQLAALVYGLTVILESRPIFLVAVLDRFVLVSSNEISAADLANGNQPQFRSRSWTGPRLVAVEMPIDAVEKGDLAFSALAGRDAQNLPKYFREYDQAGKSLLKHAKSVETMTARKPGATETIDAAVKNLKRSPNDVVWVPLQARKQDMTMLIDAHNARPLVALDIDPW